jgi:hypothetical protein
VNPLGCACGDEVSDCLVVHVVVHVVVVARRL